MVFNCQLFLLLTERYFCLYTFLWITCISRFYFAFILFLFCHSIFTVRTQTIWAWVSIFICKKLWGERKVYLDYIYISCMYVLVLRRKLCLRPMNRLNSLKLVQHFNAHNSNQRKEKEIKKENIQFTTFRCTCNSTKPFEVARGTFTDRMLL